MFSQVIFLFSVSRIQTLSSMSTLFSAQDYPSTIQPSMTINLPTQESTLLTKEFPTATLFSPLLFTSSPSLSIVTNYQASTIDVTTLLQRSTIYSVIQPTMISSDLTNRQSLSLFSNLKESLSVSTKLEVTPTTSITPSLYSIQIFSTIEPCWITTFIAYSNQTVASSLSDVIDFRTTSHIIKEQQSSVINSRINFEESTAILSRSSNIKPDLQTSFQSNIHMSSSMQSSITFQEINIISTRQAIEETFKEKSNLPSTNIYYTNSIGSVLFTEPIESDTFSEEKVTPSLSNVIPFQTLSDQLKRALNDQPSTVDVEFSSTSIDSFSTVIIKPSWSTGIVQPSYLATRVQNSMLSSYTHNNLFSIQSISNVNAAGFTSTSYIPSLSTSIIQSSQSKQSTLSTLLISDISMVSFTPTLNEMLSISATPSLLHNVTSVVQIFHPSRVLSTSSGYYTSILDSCLRIYSTIIFLPVSSAVDKTSKFPMLDISSTINSVIAPTSTQYISIMETTVHNTISVLPNSLSIVQPVSTNRISPSSSSLNLIDSTSVVINSTSTMAPSTTATPSNLLEITLRNITINENNDSFRIDIEQKLVNTYVAAKQLEQAKRKRRAATSETYEVQVHICS